MIKDSSGSIPEEQFLRRYMQIPFFWLRKFSLSSKLTAFTEDARQRFEAFSCEQSSVKLQSCPSCLCFFGSASRKVCLKVERTNVFLSSDARILTSPSLQQSFKFHARTDIAQRVARE